MFECELVRKALHMDVVFYFVAKKKTAQQKHNFELLSSSEYKYIF